MTTLIDSENAYALLAELALPEEEYRLLHAPRYWHEAVCLELFERCDELVFIEPKRAPDLAVCAVKLASRVPAEHCHGGRAQALRGKAYYVYGTALRGIDELEAAENAYTLSALFLKQEGLALERAELTLRLAILRTAQRRFEVAVELASKAIQSFRILGDDLHMLGRALLFRGFIYGQALEGDLALQDLSAALSHLDPERSAQLHYSAIHNLSAALMKTAHNPAVLKEASGYLDQARTLAHYQPDSLPLIKLRWIEGAIQRKLGNFRQAEILLTEAREGLERHNARLELVMLDFDIAELYHEQNRGADLQALTATMFPHFRVFRPFEQAYWALIHFHDAVMAGKVSGRLIASVRQTVWDCGATSQP